MPAFSPRGLDLRRPNDWPPEQRAAWIEDYRNGKPGLLPIPLHPEGSCTLCDAFHDLAREAQEVKHT